MTQIISVSDIITIVFTILEEQYLTFFSNYFPVHSEIQTKEYILKNEVNRSNWFIVLSRFN